MGAEGPTYPGDLLTGLALAGPTSRSGNGEKGAVTMHDIEKNSQVGGTAGAASHPTSDETTAEDRSGSGTSGDIEIPIGVPMDAEEFSRFKEEARNPRRASTGKTADSAQEDEGRDRWA
jgi:hypothetical protein